MKEFNIGHTQKFKIREMNDKMRKLFNRVDAPVQIIVGYLSLPENLLLPKLLTKRNMLLQLLEYSFANLEEIRRKSDASQVLLSTFFSEENAFLVAFS